MRRREFLTGSVAAAGALAVPRLLLPRFARADAIYVFAHGVASGDPTSGRVIVWTRVTPSVDATPGSGRGPAVTVRWEVARDPAFADVVRSGEVQATALRDHTVKIDVPGLDPRTDYHYRFHAIDQTSPSGRTRTAPAPDQATDHLRFGFVSCSDYQAGHFAPYRYLAERGDLDAVLHLGDYYYEYGVSNTQARRHDPEHEVLTLEDYRRRIACYRGDPDLRALHAAYPWIMTWDDHEIANNTWRDGAQNHQPDEGPFAERRAAAHRAYFEWMPVRDQPDDPTRIYRNLRFGTLADLSMLDLRSYRDAQAFSVYADAITPLGDVDDPSRTITGDAQMDWLLSTLDAEDVRWRLVGTSVMVTPIHFPPLPRAAGDAFAQLGLPVSREGIAGNIDQWDGYTADRRRLLDHIASNAIDDVVFLVGDVHSTFACDIPLDPALYPYASPSIATELVSTSVTSDNFDEITRTPPRTATRVLEEEFKANNRHIKHYEFDSHGWSVIDVTPERLQTDWYYVHDRADPDTGYDHAVSFAVRSGTNRVEQVADPV